jgi:hypothetical protein
MVSERTSKVKRQQSPETSAAQSLQPSVPEQKSVLVDLGLEYLAKGEFGVVATITLIIQERRWSHE